MFPDLEKGGLATYRAAAFQEDESLSKIWSDDLGITSYAVYSNKKADLKTKDRADLLEAFLGALYVDKGLNTAKRSATCVIECNGPTNTRVYTMAVYFRGKHLACSNGHSIQEAKINAAKQALENSKDLFPQLDHQKRVIAQSLKRQKVRTGDRFDHERRDSLNSSTDPYRKRRRFLIFLDILSRRI
ncbi:ribonuclease iii [Culex quinquefasciatus]|uniref:Ribonuclease iii n=1 Tax=Culex quinquefasciatus TaxID=7176 RepID=B0WWG0_CULQU|nr:ribonuclease iii [Culex quinquefasciatus]|eukprot:XP_001861732.1 ribonuclease iii [Culex quinquefasciatus]